MTSASPPLLAGFGHFGNRLAAIFAIIAVERLGTHPQNNAWVVQRLGAVRARRHGQADIAAKHPAPLTTVLGLTMTFP